MLKYFSLALGVLSVVGWLFVDPPVVVPEDELPEDPPVVVPEDALPEELPGVVPDDELPDGLPVVVPEDELPDGLPVVVPEGTEEDTIPCWLPTEAVSEPLFPETSEPSVGAEKRSPNSHESFSDELLSDKLSQSAASEEDEKAGSDCSEFFEEASVVETAFCLTGKKITPASNITQRAAEIKMMPSAEILKGRLETEKECSSISLFMQ